MRPPAATEIPPAAPTTHQIRVVVTPVEAIISLDGKPQRSNPFDATVLDDGKPHRIVASAQGYRSVERQVVADRDLLLQIILEPLPPALGIGTLPQGAAASSALPVAEDDRTPASIDTSNPWADGTPPSRSQPPLHVTSQPPSQSPSHPPRQPTDR
jgi:hypothetical protein